jgi:hypothetical protein
MPNRIRFVTNRYVSRRDMVEKAKNFCQVIEKLPKL